MATTEEDVEFDDEENILYDLTVHGEWPQEAETFTRGPKEKAKVSIWRWMLSTSQRSAWTLLRTLGFPLKLASSCTLPVGLVKIINCQITWNIAVGREGQVVAILQDHFIEIRSNRDEYSTVIGRGSVSKDAYPQWRQLVWCCDATMLACSHSCGSVDLYDMVGTHLFNIPSTVDLVPGAPVDLSLAVSGLVFTQASQVKEGTLELLVINYQGSLRSYMLDCNSQYTLDHTFVFSQHYPQGVTSVVYHPVHKILIVGGYNVGSQISSAAEHGISMWRILSDYPYYKKVTDYEEDLKFSQQESFLKRLPFRVWKSNPQNQVFKMCLSPDSTKLVSLSNSGCLSLWHVPSLKKINSWRHEEQPGHNDVSPEYLEKPHKRRLLKDLIKSKNLLDVNWWSDEALILARCSGAVTLASRKTLRNLLGISPEWFEPAPRITKSHDGQFLGLECECRFQSKHRLLKRVDTHDDSDDEDEMTWMSRSTNFAKHILCYVTDRERFQPPRKKPKLVNRTYRLVCLRSTTPEELYAQKIDNEEYGEALLLARAYNLDCDLVYQRQWRKSPVSLASIQDYLRKIKKRSWVLHECLERVSDDVDAMRELLEYGLRGTDLQAMVAIGKGEDEGRFIVCDDTDLFDQYDENEQMLRRHLLDQVDFSKLLLEQRELCRVRYKLLQYLYRLKTYELILGGIHTAAERYDPKFFEIFRSQNIVEAAVQFARDSNWTAVEVLFTYHGSDVLPHRLPILSNFPETASPLEYCRLLPEVGDDEKIFPWEIEEQGGGGDWSEMQICRSAVETRQFDLGESLYEENRELEKFRGMNQTKHMLTDWYKYRACEIERLSRHVDNAVQLINLGMEREVKGLEDLLDDLITMDTLVYECHVSDSVSFENLQKMTDIEKINMLMQKSSEEMYVKNIHRWLIPFLKRCERKDSKAPMQLLQTYLTQLAKDDLSLVLKIFEASKSNVAVPIITSPKDCIRLALTAIYTCQRDDQLTIAQKIVKTLPTKSSSHKGQLLEMFDQKDELENHLWAAQTLEAYGLRKPVYTIKNAQETFEDAQILMIKLTRSAGRRSAQLTVDDWVKLHTSVMQLQERVFHCLPASFCLEIYVTSILCSNKLKIINMAQRYIEPKMDSAKSSSSVSVRVPHAKAVELVLSAAQEYFNSAANLTDYSMNLARVCLDLIQDNPDSIIEEYQLIDSLSLLNEFAINVLPLQVRLWKDRLDLVKMALVSKPQAYKEDKKLLKLGQLLRVSAYSDAGSQGQILKLITETALQAADYDVSFSRCKQLMELGYAAAWTVCMDLAMSEKFQDMKAKLDLLSFAVTYCSPDMIEPILQARALLETQILYDSVSSEQCEGGGDIYSTPRESLLSAKVVLKQTGEILSSTSKMTKGVILNAMDTKWWQTAIHSLVQAVPKHKHSMPQICSRQSGERIFEKQGCHPFYAGIIENSVSDDRIADYKNISCSLSPDIETSQNILHAVKLEETLTEGERFRPVDEVLLQLACATMPYDFTLGLAYLLALSQIQEAEKCFKQLPNIALSLQLAEYYYALQVFNGLRPYCGTRIYQLFQHAPKEVIAETLNHVNKNPGFDWPETIQFSVGKLKYYKERLEDYIQARLLQNIGKGVDVVRFTEDNEYKHETILGLAMTLEDNVFNLAASLASRYDLSLWEVYMTHLEFLFSDSGLNTQAVEKRLKHTDILPELLTKPREFSERMYKYVYPTIRGSDQASLLYYYTLLQDSQVVDPGHIQPSIHVLLLQKLKSAAPNLNYKHLMDGQHGVMDVLQPVLTRSNVYLIAKLAPKIPDLEGGSLHASVVFSAWGIRLFWEGEQGKNQEPENDAAWIHRYESCGEFIQKMLPADFVKFIDCVCFTSKSRDLLSLNCREEIVKRALKYSRQEGGKRKKQDDSSCDVKWETAASYFNRYVHHLHSVGHVVIQRLMESTQSAMQSYAELYDLSRGDEQQLKNLHVQILLDCYPLDLLNDILSISSVQGWNSRATLRQTLQLALNRIRNPESHPELFNGHDVIVLLEKIVNNVRAHLDKGGSLVSQEDVLSLLRPFCSDSTVAIQPRLEVLRTMEKSFELKSGDAALVVFYRTGAVMKASWPEQQLDENDVHSDEARQKLFEVLLSKSSSKDQFASLCQLLSLWPPLKSMETRIPPENPWIQIFTSVMSNRDSELLGTWTATQAKMTLNLESTEYVVNCLLEANLVVDAVKLALISKHTALQESTIWQLNTLATVSEDEELFHLILKNHLIKGVVNSKYYKPLVDFLLGLQHDEQQLPDHLKVDGVVQDLKHAGFDAEAGSLLMKARNIHPMLQRFDAVCEVLQHWVTS